MLALGTPRDPRVRHWTVTLAAGGGLGCPTDMTAPPEVIAIFGSTASESPPSPSSSPTRLGTEVVSADALQVYRGLPILTNQPTRRRGSSRQGSRRRDVRGRVRAARPRALDELVEPNGVGSGRRRDRPLPARRARRPRAAAASGARRARTRGGARTTPTRRLLTPVSRSSIPRPRALVHPNDRRRVVRALELAEAGRLSFPTRDRLWSTEYAAADARRRARRAAARRSSAESASRTEEMFAAASSTRCVGALRRPSPAPPRRRWACRSSPSFHPSEALRAIVRPDEALCRVPEEVDAPDSGHRHDRRRPERRTRWRMRFSKWQALGNTYLLVERADSTSRSHPMTRGRSATRTRGVGADGVLEIVDVRGAEADVLVWNADGSRAELSRQRSTHRGASGSHGEAALPFRGSISASGRCPRACKEDEVEVDLGEVAVGQARGARGRRRATRVHAGLGRESARGYPPRADPRRAPSPRPARREPRRGFPTAPTSSSSAPTARTT